MRASLRVKTGSRPIIQRTVERREDPRYERGVSGSFSLAGARSAAGEQVFACHITSLSASGMVLVAAVHGEEGELILVDIEGYGLVRCEVDQVREDDFVCRVLAGEDQKRKLGAFVSLLRRRGGRVLGDQRRHMRLRPPDPRTTLTLEDGTVHKALVTDLSRSGAAISSVMVPDVGAPVVIGETPARVVRRLAVGFAVEFERVLEAREADELVAGYMAVPDEDTAPG